MHEISILISFHFRKVEVYKQFTKLISKKTNDLNKLCFNENKY